MKRPWIDHYDYWVQPHMNYPRRPLGEILKLTASDIPDRTATAFLGASLTWAEVKERSDRLGTALARFGIAKGDRVGIMLPNCPQYVIAAFAILRIGGIVVNVNPLYTPREIGVVAADSGMRLLITLDLLAPNALAIRNQTDIEAIMITSAGEQSVAVVPCPAVEGTLRLSDVLANVTEANVPNVSIDPESDVAVLQYTGGTTGVPKGAMLTHYNIFANVIQTSVLHHPDQKRGEERILLVIPFFHIYGFTVGLIAGAWQGAQQILIPKYDVEALLTAIRDFRPTYFPAVPTIYVSILNHPKAREYGIDKVRAFNCGSAPLPLEVIDQFERMTGGTLNEGYGLSEASPVTHTTPSLSRRKPGSIGIPLPDTDIKIVDLVSGLNEVAPGAEGELCIAGPQVMQGYWNRPDETAIALRKDARGRVWLYTGDVARMDDDGYCYIVQRKKDMIIVGGFNVYPSEIESVLFAHPAVMEAVVIGVPHLYYGEVVKAFVVPKPGARVSADDLRSHCATNLAEFKRPVEIEFRQSLPKSAVGKILRRELREEARAVAQQS
ncbi:MAG TPA: long-chain fatty acid--CoA ligase [Thermoanaerobaculia bacterium]|nr:long-chain fatty acid--CoA ligase [Thermoanaerobaculia bacterium]